MRKRKKAESCYEILLFFISCYERGQEAEHGGEKKKHAERRTDVSYTTAISDMAAADQAASRRCGRCYGGNPDACGGGDRDDA